MRTLFEEAWAMEPLALRALRQAIERLPHEAALDPLASQPSSAKGEDSVAVIPVKGVLMRHVPPRLRAYVDATDITELRAAVERADADEDVSRIVLLVDSPGGQVGGIADAADAIFAARKSKRVEAVVEGIAASGAYWLASQAHSISASADARVGAIGVYQVVADSSEAAAAEGIRVHVVRSGEHKGLGVPGAPVRGEHLSMLQAVVDGLARLFTSAVARGRPRAALSDVADGALWLGGQALEKGIVDRVEFARDALRRIQALSGQDNAREVSRAPLNTTTNERTDEPMRQEVKDVDTRDVVIAALEHVAATGCSKTEAIKYVAKTRPEFYEAAKRSGAVAATARGADAVRKLAQHPFLAAVQDRKRADSCSYAEAHGRVSRERPELAESFANASRTAGAVRS